MDELDQKIVRILTENCLTPFVSMARKLRVAEGTVRYRVRRLQKQGIIQGFRAIIDPVHLGLGTAAFVAITVIPSYLPQVAAAVANLESVLAVYETHTYGDLLLKIQAATPSNLSDLITTEIKTIEGVTSSQVVPVLKVWKDRT
jgi:DNA-binding Lrp family transcriptional regulator